MTSDADTDALEFNAFMHYYGAVFVFQLYVPDAALRTQYCAQIAERRRKRETSGSPDFDDSGFDLIVPNTLTVASNSRATTLDHGGVCCRAGLFMVDTTSDSDELLNRPSAYYMYPRSSISKSPLRLANSVGIIDAGYRGALMAKVDNISNAPYVIEAGSRLFQLCTPTLGPFLVQIVDTWNPNETIRGEGGFGSTSASSNI